jgi:hypothetical protein
VTGHVRHCRYKEATLSSPYTPDLDVGSIAEPARLDRSAF